MAFLLERKGTHGILDYSTFTPFWWWPKWQRMDGVTGICHDCLLSASCSPSCSQWSRIAKHRRLFKAKQNKAIFGFRFGKGIGINPYEAPVTIDTQLVGMSRSIRVGLREFNTVIISMSLWSGVRTCVRDHDGIEGSIHRGPVELKVGENETHTVRVEVDGGGSVNAYIDGKLVERDLFASLRRRILLLVTLLICLAFFVTSVLVVLTFVSVVK